MKLCLVSSEAVPFAKTGGLGDVVGALAAELARRGHDVVLIHPFYPVVRAHLSGDEDSWSDTTRVGSRDVPFKAVTLELTQNFRAIFIDCPEYFDRENLYTDSAGEGYVDNAERFILLVKSALSVLARESSPVDCIHAHDWQTALMPVYLKHCRRFLSDRTTPGCVLTIHNLAFQGRFPRSMWHLTGLDDSTYTVDGLEFWGDWSMLKGGILAADQISTVSPNYAKEIRQPLLGEGLDGVIRQRAHRLTGVINGIDTHHWNPANDTHLVHPYDSRKWLEGKAACKADLQQRTGLPLKPTTPLVGMVGRMTEQKGFQLVNQAAKDLLNRDVQFVVLGKGDGGIERMLSQWGQWYSDRAYVCVGFDESLARRIYAGSDMFLMPSQYEPCGLSQLYALRYGSVPIVHATGGLIDTVCDATPSNLENGSATGFHFLPFSAREMLGALVRANEAYRSPTIWRQLVEAGMNQDWSWARIAQQYEEVYRRSMALASEDPRTA